MKVKIKLCILTFLNRLIPKDRKKIAFMSHPDFSDNTKGMYEYIANNTNYECIWFVSSDSIAKQLNELGIKTYIRNNLNGFFEFAKCKYAISSDFENLAIKSSNQIHIGLSHGMPLKKSGLLLNDLSKDTAKAFKKIDYTICTSKMFQSIIGEIFGLPNDKVLISGHPRNDFLFKSDKRKEINSMLKVDLENYEKVIMYIPTFRKHAYRNDGHINIDNIVNLNKYDEKDLNEFLKENNYLLITKLHPAEQACIEDKKLSNIKMLDSSELINEKITLNEILNLADLLITDYSSVYYDYMILDRPLLFINTDEDEYSKKRGFVFDDDLELYRPGPKVSTLDALKEECKKLLSDETYFMEERIIANNRCNDYKDDKSSERLFESIFKA